MPFRDERYCRGKFYQQYQQYISGPPLLNQGSSNGDVSSVLTAVGASMAAHPVGWAIGAIVLAGTAAYFAFK